MGFLVNPAGRMEFTGGLEAGTETGAEAPKKDWVAVIPPPISTS